MSKRNMAIVSSGSNIIPLTILRLAETKSIIPIKIAINVFGYVHLTVVLTCCMNRAGALLFLMIGTDS